MNYEKNLQFIKYYVENVLLDMQSTLISLFKETTTIEEGIKTKNVPKYNGREIYEIFIKHVNEIEYDKFCRILKLGNGWNLICNWLTNERHQLDYFEQILKKNSEQYFRDQRRYLKKQERKNRNLLKN